MSGEGSVRDTLQQMGMRALRAGGVDHDGLWRCKQLNVGRMSANPRVSQSDFVFGIDVLDQLYEPTTAFTNWETGWPDVEMRIDPSTIRAVPWESGIATAICDYVDGAGEPLELCPRGILRGVVERARRMGYEPDVAMELEFFVFRGRPDPDSPCPPELLQQGNHGYHPFRGMELIDRWSRALEDYGIPVEGTLTEWGESQFEINIDHGNPVEVADQILMVKHGLKALAAREDLTVSFMARPLATGPGSSGHVHVSLWNDEHENVFWQEGATANASPILGQFAAGLVRNLPEMAVLTLPLVNSYKRVGEYLSSPTRLNLGYENRTTGLRIIAHDEAAARLEVRIPGADANPYLAMAAILAAGLDGIDRADDPMPVRDGDGYADTESPQLPRDLTEGVERLDGSTSARELLGTTFVDHYVHSRKWELAQWRQAVTDWEYRRYGEIV